MCRHVLLPAVLHTQGMGEPLNNYDAVCAAVCFMTEQRYFGLGRKQVTVSTVGVVPRIRTLHRDLPVGARGLVAGQRVDVV